MSKYQLLGPLTEEERIILEKDILQRGVQVPVEFDEAGNVLDGHTRKEIAEKNSLSYPKIVRSFKDEAEKKSHVLMLNMARRHLRPHQWGQAFGEILKIRGVERKRGQRNDLTSDTMSEVAKELGVDERTARRRLRAADDYLALPKAQRKKVDLGETSATAAQKKLEKEKREEERKRQAATVAEINQEDCRLLLSDFRNAEIEDGSIDVVVTDPPYEKGAIEILSSLSAFSARVLKPGGSLICMMGQSYLPEVIGRLSEHLRYHWCLAYLTPGGQSVQLWNRNVNTFWKPLLWFVNGDYSGPWVGDVTKSETNDNDKRFHGWGQSESGMRDVLSRFSEPGDLVCDPFLGGGTTGYVALRMGRKFIGIEKEEKAFEEAKKRIGCS